MTSLELKPCPHCGGAATIRCSPLDGTNYYSIGCLTTRCRGNHPMRISSERSQTVTEWNTRVDESEYRELYESLCRKVSHGCIDMTCPECDEP